MKFLVSEKLSPHKYKTAEGYLVCVDAVLARTGKQSYMRDEIFGDGDETIVEVDRSPDEVFSEATLASFENKPVTVEHPDEDVNSENFKEYSVGFVRDVHRGVVDGQEVILGTLVIQDAQTIEEIENGEHTDLSCGYDCDIQDEENPQQRNIRGNHVALCQEGRAGNAKIMDSRKNLLDVSQKCVICGETFDGYGNNAEPVKKGICCDVCNSKYVIPARINQLKKDSIPQEYEGIKKHIGEQKWNALLKYVESKGKLLSNVVYKPEEFEKFESWLKNGMKDSKEQLRRYTGNLIREEVNAVEEYDNTMRENKLTPKEQTTLEEIRNDEIDHANKLNGIYQTLKEGAVEDSIEDDISLREGQRVDYFGEGGIISNIILNGYKTLIEFTSAGKLLGRLSYEEVREKIKQGKIKLLDSEFSRNTDVKDVNPREGETKEEFISRFMRETESEYPDEKQRYAVANSYWERKDVKDSYYTENEKKDKTFVKNAIEEMEKYIQNWDYLTLKEKQRIDATKEELRKRVNELRESLNDSVKDSNCKDNTINLKEKNAFKLNKTTWTEGKTIYVSYEIVDNEGNRWGSYDEDERNIAIREFDEITQKTKDSKYKDDNILGRKVIIRPRDVRMDKYVDEKGTIFSYEGTNDDDRVEVKLNNGEYVEVRYDEIRLLDSVKDSKMTTERMKQIITPIVKEFAKKNGVEDYWAIHVNGKNVSVGMELGYRKMDELCDILNRKLSGITESYFEPADSGLIETTVFDSVKDESMFMILNKDKGAYLYNVDISAAQYSLTNNANKADKFTLNEANRIINILKKYNFDNLITSEFLDSNDKVEDVDTTKEVTENLEKDFEKFKESKMKDANYNIKFLGFKIEFIEGSHQKPNGLLNFSQVKDYLIKEDNKIAIENPNGYKGYDKCYVDFIYSVNGKKYTVHGARADLNGKGEYRSILPTQDDVSNGEYYLRNYLETGDSHYGNIHPGDSKCKDDLKSEIFKQSTINLYEKDIKELMRKGLSKQDAVEHLLWKLGKTSDEWIKEAASRIKDTACKDTMYSISWKNGKKRMKSSLMADSLDDAILKFSKYIAIRGIKDSTIIINSVKTSDSKKALITKVALSAIRQLKKEK